MSDLVLKLVEQSLFVSYRHDEGDDTSGITINGVIVRPPGLGLHDLQLVLTCRDEAGRVLHHGDLYLEADFEGDEQEFSKCEWLPTAIFTRTARIDLKAVGSVRITSKRMGFTRDQIECLPTGGT